MKPAMYRQYALYYMYGLCLLAFSQDKGSVVLSYHYIRHLIVSVVQLGSVGCFRAPEHMGT